MPEETVGPEGRVVTDRAVQSTGAGQAEVAAGVEGAATPGRRTPSTTTERLTAVLGDVAAVMEGLPDDGDPVDIDDLRAATRELIGAAGAMLARLEAAVQVERQRLRVVPR